MFKHISALFLTLVLVAASAFGQQNTLTQTSLATSVTASQTVITVASATNIAVTSGTSNGSILYVVDVGEKVGEVMIPTAVSSTSITVRRTAGRTRAHANGAMVLVGNPNWFYSSNPSGSCVAASTYVTPYVNTVTGEQWLCSTVTLTWVPGFGNHSAPLQATAAVASAAGLITPSGPLFHITGTAAITGFNIPVGFLGSRICAIPDAIFTTTSANNIALASTAVVSKALCWEVDAAAAKPFFPSY